ncbi:LRP2-binding protein like [Argiope bruennichi]|uniref:LRP2-binding protein n=1 Tax=Argiope bruennichi TaxID=94029 RepID=A0A8T0EJ71_ARGBR|nr:LRP2-binding protein like [Argiope bruennichi]
MEDLRPGEEGVLAIALFYMGELCYKGIVVPKDNELAEKHWLRGAMIKKDPVTGLHYYGSVECQTALGMFYSNPEFLDMKKAFKWHKRAQESGSVISEGALGVMYLYGLGTEENLQLAYHYLTNAASYGNTYAKGYLAAYYYKRQMYDRTVATGRELAAVQDCKPLAKAEGCPVEHVKRGVSMGCFYLALCSQYGYAMIQDKALAQKLIKKAIELSPDVAYDLHAKAILGIA